VITPALKDDELLADIRRAQHDTNHVHLWWLGQSGFLFQYRGFHVLLDPYLSDSLTKKYATTDRPHARVSERVVDPARLDFIDVITSSHAHTDHLDAETLRPILSVNESAWFVAPAANIDVVRERVGSHAHLVMLKAHDSFEHEGACITAVPAAHDKREYDDRGQDRYLGYVIRLGRAYIYHSGDTVRFDHQVESVCISKRIDIALLPINGKLGNLNGVDAARLARDIGAKLVVPCHYDMFEFNTADPREQFIPECERLGQPYRVLKLGERLTLDPKSMAGN
jgi:L-ascorbate metabolism protein UlaG (beta-lactamase superfamily)